MYREQDELSELPEMRVRIAELRDSEVRIQRELDQRKHSLKSSRAKSSSTTSTVYFV